MEKQLIEGISNEDLVRAFKQPYEAWKMQDSMTDGGRLYIQIDEDVQTIFGALWWD
jgi:hypothetical protein